MNYTFQSFNFRGRQSARPFYDIAAEEYGHIELVGCHQSHAHGCVASGQRAPAG